MCLLVHQPAAVTFDAGFLADVHAQNRDGLGIMYAENGRLHVYKTLPTTAAEFIDFYNAHAADRECIWHARMQTHGDIDIDNCHPYRVTDSIYLAHNGVLSSGNDADVTRSDTWHFIHNVIQPAAEHNPEIIQRPEWQTFIGSMIGRSNKFGLMTSSGDAIIINREAGIEFEGAWLSNTYAWPAHKYNAAPRTVSTTRYAYDYEYGYGYGYGYDRDYTTRQPAKITTKPTAKPTAIKPSKASLPSLLRAARNCFIRGTLDQWVQDTPAKAAALVDEIEDYAPGESLPVVLRDPLFAVEIIEDWFASEGLTANK